MQLKRAAKLLTVKVGKNDHCKQLPRTISTGPAAMLCLNHPLIVLMILLTHICRMDFPIIIIWTSPLSILGESGVFFHFYFIFIEIPVSPDEAPRSVVSHLGLHVYCLPLSQK